MTVPRCLIDLNVGTKYNDEQDDDDMIVTSVGWYKQWKTMLATIEIEIFRSCFPPF